MRIPHSRFLTLLYKEAGNKRANIILACFFSGFVHGLAIYSVLLGLDQLTKNGIQLYVLLLFLFSLFFSYALFQYCLQKTTTIALEGTTKLQQNIIIKLRGLSFEDFSTLKNESSQVVLFNFQDMLVEAVRILMTTLANSIMVFVAIAQMFFTSIPSAIIICILIGIGFFIYMGMVQNANDLGRKTKDTEQSFAKEFQAIRKGFLYLKLDLSKTSDLFKKWIFPSLQSTNINRTKMEATYTKGLTWISTYSLGILGILLFVLPWFMPIGIYELTKLIVLIIFCIGPLMNLVSLVPIWGKVETDLELLEKLMEKIDNSIEIFEHKYMADKWSNSEVESPSFKNLCIKDVRFNYKNNNYSSSFTLNVTEFKLEKKEIVFLTGNNGSSKTSFLHLLCGLYLPSEGKFLLNNHDILDEDSDYNIVEWRNLFSIVPVDFYLFKHFVGINASSSFMQKVLKMVGLEDKVSVEDENYVYNTLSKGEAKRLALAYALLEDKDIYLFDEIATDFDADFKKYFYNELLTEMRNQGKTILIATCDTNYQACADRVIVINDGIIQ